jgi:hypothetical protein
MGSLTTKTVPTPGWLSTESDPDAAQPIRGERQANARTRFFSAAVTVHLVESLKNIAVCSADTPSPVSSTSSSSSAD